MYIQCYVIVQVYTIALQTVSAVNTDNSKF